MILCLAQLSPCWNDPGLGLEKMRKFAVEASQKDADLIAFPEQFLTGWDPDDTSFATKETGSLVGGMRDIAREAGIGIIGSFREESDNKPKNTCIAIGPDGDILAKYSKIHLFSPGGEDEHYLAGKDLGIFRYGSCKTGLAICYDLRFSPLFQAYRDKGVELMIVPSAWPSSRIKYLTLFTRSRAAEFQFFVASVNTVGPTPVDNYSGETCIAGPDGTIRACGGGNEELVYYDIREEEVRSIRANFPVYRDYSKTDYKSLK